VSLAVAAAAQFLEQRPVTQMLAGYAEIAHINVRVNDSDAPGLRRLLRARRKRPKLCASRRRAEPCHKFTPPHSITGCACFKKTPRPENYFA
jgi:hypothetical protein